MASDNKISMPGVFGGLMRFDEEYKSRFMLRPEHVLVLVLLIVVFVIVLNMFWPAPAAPMVPVTPVAP